MNNHKTHKMQVVDVSEAQTLRHNKNVDRVFYFSHVPYLYDRLTSHLNIEVLVCHCSKATEEQHKSDSLLIFLPGTVPCKQSYASPLTVYPYRGFFQNNRIKRPSLRTLTFLSTSQHKRLRCYLHGKILLMTVTKQHQSL
jgi:hypothetical protein